MRREGDLVRGAVTRVDESGARIIPWWEASTAGEVGLKAPGVSSVSQDGRGTRLKGVEGTRSFAAPEVRKTSPQQKAEWLTSLLVAQIEVMKRALGRDVTAGDLSEQWLRALGAELWKEGEPVTVSRLRQVAQRYLEATPKNPDARWTPGPVK